MRTTLRFIRSTLTSNKPRWITTANICYFCNHGFSKIAEYFVKDGKATDLSKGSEERQHLRVEVLSNEEGSKGLEAGIADRGCSKRAADGGQEGIRKTLSNLRSRSVVTQATKGHPGSKEAAEALLAAGDRRAQEQRGDIVSALQSGDPRAAASLLGTLEKIGVDDDARRAQALGMKAGAEQQRAALTEKEKDFQSALDQMLMDRGAMAADEGRRTLLDLAERSQGAAPAATASGVQTATALGTLLKDYDPGNPGDDKEYGGRIKAEAGMRYLADEGFKTKGEFNHDTNKKAVIDEENGEEAELTWKLYLIQTSLR